jgi:crossover junction endodeoxyribonuclease RuvC
MTERVRIIGIDPGLRRCGWGIIEAALFAGIGDLVRQFSPDEAAVEETFVNQGARSALQLGQARGVALMTPASMGLPVAEYAANLIKKSVVGAGHAEKPQIQAMVKILLPQADVSSADAADALAVAICHAHHRSYSKLVASA